MAGLAPPSLVPARSADLTEAHTPSTAKPTNAIVKWRLVAIVIVCLVIVGSRVVRLSTLEMDRDEVWSVWQTFGTPYQIIHWTPYDWPPLYYLLVGGWRVLTGISPFTLRLMSLFLFLPGMALVYRIGARLFNDTAALIAVAACAALGYVIHISIMVRAYSLIFTLVMLAWYLAIRYFDRPSTGRGIGLGLCILVLLNTHFSTIFPVAIVGLYTLVIYGRRTWRWWLPALIAGVGVIPELATKLSLATGRATSGMAIFVQWMASGANIYRQNLAMIMQNLGGYSFNLFAVFVFLAAFLIISRYGLQRKVMGLLVWMLAPVIFFFAVLFDAFSERQFVWAMAGYGLWIGWGMSQLPRAAIAGLLSVFLVITVSPVPITESYKGVDTPLVEAYTFLNQHLQAGDVVLIDPGVAIAPEEWDYFTRAYFPHGLQWVQQPGGYRRVWYFSTEGKPSAAVFEAVQKGRVAEESIHTGGLALQLYEEPPDLTGVLFANGMRFNGAELLDQVGPVAVLRAGETLRFRLWWSIDRAVKLDYSVGTYVFSPTAMLAQFDGPPQTQNDPHETSRWVQGRYYVEERDIMLPSKMVTDTYSVLLAVYGSWDSLRISAPTTNADALLPIFTFQIKAW
ncbi:MAG TPA: glycosyltransferase family 39 protein [Aggregatilineales bacterium]|nr:glycosyltransferase family 39 protein [Aggregatilineales bacterium]